MSSTSGANLTSEGERLSMEPASRDEALADRSQPAVKRSMKQILKSYFYWTYGRGSFHYDVMVTLILAFIFITPWLWDYGDKPTTTIGQTQPMLVTGDGSHGVIITV